MTVLTHITFLSYFYKSPASKAAQAPAKPRAQSTPNPNGPHLGLEWAALAHTAHTGPTLCQRANWHWHWPARAPRAQACLLGLYSVSAE